MKKRKGRLGHVDVGMLVAETATRMRAGASAEKAWGQTCARAGFEDGDAVDDVGVPAALRRMWASRGRKSADDVRLGVPPAVAVCRLTRATGAPAADVLDACAAGITDAAESAAARRAALAGPKASARMLAWLPLLGLFLGSLMGTDTLDFLLSSGLGRTLSALGLAFEALGIFWVRRLVRRAEREG